MSWVIIGKHFDTDENLYGRVDDDGLMRVTAVEGYPALDEWLSEGNEPEVIEEP